MYHNVNLLYHGTCNGQYILNTGTIEPMSSSEYSFDVAGSVLSLTRSIDFAVEYSKQFRDGPPVSRVYVFDRVLLRATHKIVLARSNFYDSMVSLRLRHECEEFVQKSISIYHKSIVSVIRV